MMKKLTGILTTSLITAIIIAGCSDLLGTKGDDVTDEIFEEGRQDPTLILDEIGYAALPFWGDYDRPTDVFVGYDQMVYVTDAVGLHVLDRAGRRNATIEFDGAVSVVQDRLLNVYVAARVDTLIKAVPTSLECELLVEELEDEYGHEEDITDFLPNECFWNLAAVYKIKNANGAGELEFIQTLVHPFMDSSRSTTATQRLRLDRDREDDNDELVEITGLSILADNTLYVTRRGPRNQENQAVSTDNTVLVFTENRDSAGNRLGTMRNTEQVRVLSPNVPSLRSGIALSDISTFVAPPQRENMTNSLSFIISQGDESRNIPLRVLWIDAVMTPDGLEYLPRSSLLARDTSRAESFLYDQFKFRNPTGVAYSADARAHIFVVDAGTDSLYLFQSNGVEGINPPPGSTATKAINVSFGGTGNGPREFNNPSGVAYFRRVVYVADTGNNRISRFKLNTDFE